MSLTALACSNRRELAGHHGIKLFWAQKAEMILIAISLLQQAE